MKIGAGTLQRRKDGHALMRPLFSHFLLVIVTVLLFNEVGAVPNLRGIAPQDEKYYLSAIIKCKDGGKTFPQERLNDGFCDCVDGTDEPGTNACPESKFYCRNWGHRSVTLYTSQVNDGICDCCDGSDEYDGRVKCPNSCRESGKQSNEKLKKKLRTFKEGYIIRSRDVENARKLRQDHQLELKRLKGEEKALKDVVARLKSEKESAEKAAKQEEEDRRKREENLNREKEKALEKEKAVENTDSQQIEEDPPSPLQPESPEEPGVVPVDSETEGGLDHVLEAELQEVADAHRADMASEENPVDHHMEMDQDNDHDDEDADDEADEDFDLPHVSSSGSFSAGEGSTGIEYSTWWSRLLIGPKFFLQMFRRSRQPVDKSELERIQREYQESHSKLQSLESQISELESRNKQDFGKDGEFYSFYDSCFEFKDKKYVYRVCPYKDATQNEGHSSTRLGSWEGFEKDHKEMIFKNGDKCWNGPYRSLVVKMRCGTKLELRAVDEPSRCEYIAELSTPAWCLESKVQALEQELLSESAESFHDEL